MLKLITTNSPLILPGLGVSSSRICQDWLYSRPLTPSIRAAWAAAHNSGINNVLPSTSTSCSDPSPKPPGLYFQLPPGQICPEALQVPHTPHVHIRGHPANFLLADVKS